MNWKYPLRGHCHSSGLTHLELGPVLRVRVTPAFSVQIQSKINNDVKRTQLSQSSVFTDHRAVIKSVQGSVFWHKGKPQITKQEPEISISERRVLCVFGFQQREKLCVIQSNSAGVRARNDLLS